MIELKNLLAKYDKFIFQEESKRVLVSRALSEVLPFSVGPEKIQIKNNTIYIDIKPLYKNEILIKRDKILENLEKYIGKISLKNIR